MIAALVNEQEPGTSNYQAVSGINEGALNAYLLSLFSPGEEDQAIMEISKQSLDDNVVQFLERFWKTLASSRKASVHHEYGPFGGLMFSNSLYNSKPVYDFIENYFLNTDSKRLFNIGIVNVHNGNY